MNRNAIQGIIILRVMIVICDPDDSLGVGALGACHGHCHNSTFYLSATITMHNFICYTPHHIMQEWVLGWTNCSLLLHRWGLLPSRGRLVKAFRQFSVVGCFVFRLHCPVFSRKGLDIGNFWGEHLSFAIWWNWGSGKGCELWLGEKLRCWEYWAIESKRDGKRNVRGFWKEET